ncbi:ABC transporter permease [Rhodoferax sp.]|uniref:FtsX-like permease family protein n=1 Tax=Rhodoferax sp. TaxID=50421 RepID=UPI0026328BAE|nr:ABC transporter permease [Rhodoferax sp.]MDD5480579.1 FtsX-like permease family protein [Rhodoferax sp.]
MLDLLKTFSWQELKQHPWRNAAAVVAVMLGVALAFSVHLINASALDEFSQAARSVGGQPDLELRGVQGQFDEALFGQVARMADVAVASPVLEVVTYALTPSGKRSLQVLGVDALVVARVAPDLMPLPDTPPGQSQPARDVLFAPGLVFLNATAQALLTTATAATSGTSPAADPVPLQLQSGTSQVTAKVAGQVRSSGRALAVMDIGAAQELFGKQGLLSRIDVRLQPGVDRDAFIRTLRSLPNWPEQVSVALPGDAQSQIDNLSRAYRVNLTVLALIALFTGAFLVFSVLSLSVAKRAQQFALLGVLGLSGRERLTLVLWESLALGVLGSACGLALGLGLAALALQLLGGDLGGGFFAGAAPKLQFSTGAAALYGALGVAAALVGGWWPARAAQHLPPAHTLKGLGDLNESPSAYQMSLFLIAAGAMLTSAPAIFGIPVAAYVSVALLLVGGITALPWLIGLLLARLTPWVAGHTLPLLAVARARHQRETAAVAVSGVVASLSLAVALTVMVASFRTSVTQWLDQVLPADLYVRSAASLSAADTVYFSPDFIQAAARLPGVAQLQAQRQVALQLDPQLPPVALIARELPNPAQNLPLVGTALAVPAGHIGIYVSEAVRDLHGASLGQTFAPLSKAFRPLALDSKAQAAPFFVAGVWRDYARQSGAIAIDRAVFVQLTGDERANDLALWLAAPPDAAQVQQALRSLSQAQGMAAADLMDFGTPGQIRATSLRIFDRSFAVTYWLQAVAIGIGLFGIAASFSAQVLARRKEFGLLAHLGLTRRQILTVVALEGAAWTVLGALAGLGLGLVVSAVLVHVVNPQSFHWTMDLMLPWLHLGGLCVAVVLAGTLTAWVAARTAASQNAVLAVKEDW